MLKKYLKPILIIVVGLGVAFIIFMLGLGVGLAVYSNGGSLLWIASFLIAVGSLFWGIRDIVQRSEEA